MYVYLPNNDADSDLLLDIEKAIVNLTYLIFNEGENPSGISAIDEVDSKIAQEETEVEDEETEDDVRMKALFAKIQLAQEETEAEDKETEDDVRMKALFAKVREYRVDSPLFVTKT